MQRELGDKRLFLLDMDGTLYLGDHLFDGTKDFLRDVKQMGGQYLFLTNNSSRGVDAYLEKMNRLGIPAVREEFLTSVDALVLYLKHHDPDRKFYAFGTRSFRRQLTEAGFSVTDRLSDDIGCLLCGFDTELTFQKLEDACILLNRGVDFIATNPDWVCPTTYGSVPDCGSVCEMLYRATARRPLVIGKPQPEMARLAMEATGHTLEETVLLGDRIYTDIACGVNAGIDTVFLLSGEGVREDIEQYGVTPTWIYDNIRRVADKLEGKS
jgi:HAD superfamily hydrolase (TIGR01450 family)